MNGIATRVPVLVGYVFRACLPPRRLAVLALPCLAILGGGLLARFVEAESDHAFAEVAGVVIFGLAVPLGTLIVGDAVLGAEVRSGTFLFTWLTPARFGEIVLARWIGAWTVTATTLVPAAALAALIAGDTASVGPIMAAVLAGAAGHLAIFVLIGCATRRAAVWSLAVVFLIERLLGAVLGSVAQLSPTWLGRAVYYDFVDLERTFGRSGVPAGGAAIGRLAVISALALGVATWTLRRMQVTGARE